jgi:hypothetical protein
MNLMKNLRKAERPLLGFFLDLAVVALTAVSIALLPTGILVTLFLALLCLAIVFALFTKHHH